MKFLVIGLGSMGKRRIRCLNSLGYNDIVGFDIARIRKIDSKEKYKIKIYEDLHEIDYSVFDAIIISVPPDKHQEYLELAVQNKVPAFVEAGVISEHTKIIINKNIKENVFIAPSCTMLFHPSIKEIKRIIHSGKYGKITNFTYHCGQYLPDWHPWENVKDFYVSNRITGGGREIVPFELKWITDIFGFPRQIKGFFDKTIEFGTEIEDSYAFTLKFKNGLGSVIIDVASRFATRSLIINFEEAQLRWNWEDGVIKVFEADLNRWIHYFQPEGNAEKGYNKNIYEQIYIDEIRAFIEGIKDNTKFPNTMENEFRVLKLLDNIENSDGGFYR